MIARTCQIQCYCCSWKMPTVKVPEAYWGSSLLSIRTSEAMIGWSSTTFSWKNSNPMEMHLIILVFMKIKKSLSNVTNDFVVRLPIQKYMFDWIYQCIQPSIWSYWTEICRRSIYRSLKDMQPKILITRDATGKS